MIIVQILGGLGNQFFQYSAGLALARRLGVPFKLDISAFDRYSTWGYQLPLYGISAEVANTRELERYKSIRLGPLSRLIRVGIVRRLLSLVKMPVFVEKKGFSYDPEIEEVSADSYLIGYWQSPRYFESVTHQIREEFQLRMAPEGRNLEVIESAKKDNSVGLHVRRGDYVSNPNAYQYHGTTSLGYYKQAVEKILKEVNDPTFYLFSDDPKWTRANLHIPGKVRVIEHNPPSAGYEDLRIMAHCKHHIIANSSFSWWGAWLASQPGQIVTVPRYWTRHLETRNTDLIPNGWSIL